MHIQVHSLINCPYSKEAVNVLTEKIRDKSKLEIIDVTQSNKEDYKLKLGVNTFPCIKIIDSKKNSLIGGLDDLLELLDKEKYLVNACNKTPKEFKNLMKKYSIILTLPKRVICNLFFTLYK